MTLTAIRALSPQRRARAAPPASSARRTSWIRIRPLRNHCRWGIARPGEKCRDSGGRSAGARRSRSPDVHLILDRVREERGLQDSRTPLFPFLLQLWGAVSSSRGQSALPAGARAGLRDRHLPTGRARPPPVVGDRRRDGVGPAAPGRCVMRWPWCRMPSPSPPVVRVARMPSSGRWFPCCSSRRSARCSWW